MSPNPNSPSCKIINNFANIYSRFSVSATCLKSIELELLLSFCLFRLNESASSTNDRALIRFHYIDNCVQLNEGLSVKLENFLSGHR